MYQSIFYFFLSGQLFNASCPYAVRTSFLRLGGGRTFLNVFSLTSRIAIRSNKLVSSLVLLIILSDILFIRRRSWSFGPWFLMPLLHSGLIRCVFWSHLPLGAPLAEPSLPGPLRIFPFRTAGMARRTTRLRAADTFCLDPTLSWDRFLAPRRRHTAKR
jgi:hypothetical protein